MKQTAKLTTQLEVVKFIAVSVWPYFFAERINKLQMNKHGLFHLVDDQFRFLSRLSSDRPDSTQFTNAVRVFESFIIGIIKGSLQNLGSDPVPEVKIQMIKAKETDAFHSLELTIVFRDKSSPSKRQK